MRRLSIIMLALLLLGLGADAATLSRIRFGYYPEKIRATLDFDTTFTYTLEESKEKIIIRLADSQASPDILNYVELNDLIISYFEVDREDQGLKITIPLNEPLPYNIFSLNDPARLVIDFNREYTNVVSGGTVIDGVEALIVSKGTQAGRITANVLKIDQSRANLFPALARKRKANPLESFINTLNPLKSSDQDKHFYRARVSEIAEEQGAVAATNGTYFAYTGRPLGTLLIDKELVSSPIHDRTALILTDDNYAYIDNILMDCYFFTPNGVRYSLTGVNQGRRENSVIMYTPAWGEQTGTDTKGIELTVVDSVVQVIQLGNSPIPRNGYVLSLSGPATQFVADNIKTGGKIEMHIKVVPYNTSPTSILHMVSGGPRLVKNGITYVSKDEERFKADIARGRAARTAVGIGKDGKVILVTVDGLPRAKAARSPKSSIGMTLEELADLMISLGAVEAMNLDGGGSTTMWIDGRVVNQPAGGSQVQVSNALVVAPKLR